jgi:4-aminobutyrate aminotransferase-like enzyme
VGLRVLDIVLRDNLVERARAKGHILHEGLRHLQTRYACIGDVRGRGLMAGLEIVADPATKAPAPALGDALAQRMLALGLSANLATLPSFGGVFRIAPPITITPEELEMGLAIMEEAFRTTEGTRRRMI